MMRKSLFFLTTIFITGCIYAQNLVIKDEQNVSIANKTFYIYNDALSLSSTKFHVGNNSVNSINFNCSLKEIANATSTEWQVCFGTECFVAFPGISTFQTLSEATVSGGSYYPDLKVAPFSFGWSTGDYGVWRVRVYDNTNIIDSSSCYIVWNVGGKPCGDINNNTLIDGAEIAGDINLNGIIDAGEIIGDMNGNGIIDVWEVKGDANGNGIIDGAETTSVFEYNNTNVDFRVFPNPVSNQLTINYVFDKKPTSANIELYDVLGQIINSYVLNESNGSLIINMNNFESGIYFYSIKQDNHVLRTERIIVR